MDAKIVDEFNAAHLFDLPSGASIYRVFTSWLFAIRSVIHASLKIWSKRSKFQITLWQFCRKALRTTDICTRTFGYAVHHALRARFCIERGRYWQAEYWISAVRDKALDLACRRRGFPANNGRGYDALPIDVSDKFKGALVASLERDELLRALDCAIEGLLSETDEVQELAAQVESQLRILTTVWE